MDPEAIADDNFIVIEVSDEEFNSAIGSEAEDNEDLPKGQANVNIKGKIGWDEESEESGIHSEECNQSPEEELLTLCRTEDVKVVGEDSDSSSSYEDADDDTDLEGAFNSDSGDGDGEDSSDAEDSHSDVDETSSKDSDEATSDSDDTGDVRSDNEDSDDLICSDDSDPIASESDDSDEADGSSASGEEDNLNQNQLSLNERDRNDVSSDDEKMETNANYDCRQDDPYETEYTLNPFGQLQIKQENVDGESPPRLDESHLEVDYDVGESNEATRMDVSHYDSDSDKMEQSPDDMTLTSPANQTEGEMEGNEGSPNSATCGSSPSGSNLESSPVADDADSSPEGELEAPNSNASSGSADSNIPEEGNASPGSNQSSPRSDAANSGSNESSPRSDIVNPGSNESSPRSDNANLGSNESSPRSDNENLGSNESSPRSDNANLGSNEPSPQSDTANQLSNEAEGSYSSDEEKGPQSNESVVSDTSQKSNQSNNSQGSSESSHSGSPCDPASPQSPVSSPPAMDYQGSISDTRESFGSDESQTQMDVLSPATTYSEASNSPLSPPEIIEQDSCSSLGSASTNSTFSVDSKSSQSDNAESPKSDVSQNTDSNSNESFENGSPQYEKLVSSEESSMDSSDLKTCEDPALDNSEDKYYDKLKIKNLNPEADDESSEDGEWSDVGSSEDSDSSSCSFDTSDSSSEALSESESDSSLDCNKNENGNRVAVADESLSSDSWDSLDSDDSWSSEDLLLSDSDSEIEISTANTNNNVESNNIVSTDRSMGSVKDTYAVGSIESMEYEVYENESDNWEDVESSSSGEEDEESDSDDKCNNSGSEESDDSGIAHKKMEGIKADELDFKNHCKQEESEDPDWEIINESVKMSEDENSTEDDSDSINGEENDASEHEEECEMYQNCSETSDSSDKANLHLMTAMTDYKPHSSVEEFSKRKMDEYLMNRRFLHDNLDENEEKTIGAKNLAEIICTPQENNLNAISFGPDYEPEEIKVGLQRFWKFYLDLKNKNIVLANELTPFLIPLLLHFETELISSGLLPLAQEIYKLFGTLFMSESHDQELRKELKGLAEIKDKKELEMNENLKSLVGRKYSFGLSVEIHEMLAKFLARVETPVLISVFSDTFIVQLKFPKVDLVEAKIEPVEERDTDDEDDMYEAVSKEEDESFQDITETETKSLSYAEEVIRRLRNNPIVGMPSITVYATTGDPVCGAMSAQGTLVAYGMTPAGIRLCKTSKAEYFSEDEEDIATENQKNSSSSSITTLNAHEGCVYGLGFHPKTKLMFSVGYDGYMRAWDLRNPSPSNRCVYSGHVGPIWTMDIAASGTMIVTGGMDSTARLWLPEKHEYARLFVGHYFDVDCVKFHPNEAYIATGSIDKTVRLWSVGDGNMVRIFTGCPGTVSALSFHESGKYIAAGGEDDIIRLWDIAEGDLLCELPTLPTARRCKDLSFCGNKLAGCFEGNKVQIWDLKKLIGGDDIGVENDVVKFYEEFGEESHDDGNCATIPAPFSISSKTEYLFKIYYKDSANVFCLGADEKVIKVHPVLSTRAPSPVRPLSPVYWMSSEDSSLSPTSLSPGSPKSEDEDSLKPPVLSDFPYTDLPEEERYAEVDMKEGEYYHTHHSIEHTNFIDDEAPSNMSADDIEEDTVRTEVATYDRLFSSTRRDDDSWLTL